MRESKAVEFKEAITGSFLKTVSAFSNYGGGSVFFGIDDDGKVVGVDDPVKRCLDIEHKINDTISPQPEYSLEIRDAEAVIELKVKGGRSKPYLYKSKAYKRNDSSTVEVDTIELTRLILEGKNIAFEQLPYEEQDLLFNCLGKAMVGRIGLASFDSDTLKTLNLLSNDCGYNNAAGILSDSNKFPGIDMAQFGESVNVIRRRVTVEGKSALDEFNEAMKFFEDCYCREEILGATRVAVESIPREAFREAIANAIVHRTWDVSAPIRIAMFEDRAEVVSPGGLPTGISVEEYLSDMISVKRNPILANVFYRLGIIEAFGTGILRIKDSYADSVSKPKFDVRSNSIAVTLPVLKANLNLTSDQELVYGLLGSARAMASSELHEKVIFSRSKLNGILKELIALDLVTTTGIGRGLKYKKI